MLAQARLVASNCSIRNGSMCTVKYTACVHVASLHDLVCFGQLLTQSSNLHTPLRHTLHTPQPAREKLHDGHHLITVARHAIARLAIALDLRKLKQTLDLVFRRGSHSRAV